MKLLQRQKTIESKSTSRGFLRLATLALLNLNCLTDKTYYFKKCSTGCVHCSIRDYHICQNCDFGYYLTDDKDCLKCKIEGCGNCDIGPNLCRQCSPGFFLAAASKCERCLDHCRVCKNEKFCNECDFLYHLNPRTYSCEINFWIIILYGVIFLLGFFGFYGLHHFFKNLKVLDPLDSNQDGIHQEDGPGCHRSILKIKNAQDYGKKKSIISTKDSKNPLGIRNSPRFTTFGNIKDTADKDLK